MYMCHLHDIYHHHLAWQLAMHAVAVQYHVGACVSCSWSCQFCCYCCIMHAASLILKLDNYAWIWCSSLSFSFAFSFSFTFCFLELQGMLGICDGIVMSACSLLYVRQVELGDLKQKVESSSTSVLPSSLKWTLNSYLLRKSYVLFGSS